jgi:hypothetical protein
LRCVQKSKLKKNKSLANSYASAAEKGKSNYNNSFASTVEKGKSNLNNSFASAEARRE